MVVRVEVAAHYFGKVTAMALAVFVVVAVLIVGGGVIGGWQWVVVELQSNTSFKTKCWNVAWNLATSSTYQQTTVSYNVVSLQTPSLLYCMIRRAFQRQDFNTVRYWFRVVVKRCLSMQ